MILTLSVYCFCSVREYQLRDFVGSCGSHISKQTTEGVVRMGHKYTEISM